MSDNYIADYWEWLGSIDPRLKDILVALDDEYCTGRVGTRQNFDGDFEYRLYKVAESAEDFIALYVQSFEESISRGDKMKFCVETEARKWWNVLTQVRNDTMAEVAEHVVRNYTKNES